MTTENFITIYLTGLDELTRDIIVKRVRSDSMKKEEITGYSVIKDTLTINYQLSFQKLHMLKDHCDYLNIILGCTLFKKALIAKLES